jgi:hypothetical protein
VSELIEAPLRTEVVIERLREHERVGDQRPPGVVTDQQHRSLGGNVVQALDIRAEVEVGPQTESRQSPFDVMRISGVEWVGAPSPGHGLSDVLSHGGHHSQIRLRRVGGSLDKLLQKTARAGHRYALPA